MMVTFVRAGLLAVTTSACGCVSVLPARTAVPAAQSPTAHTVLLADVLPLRATPFDAGTPSASAQTQPADDAAAWEAISTAMGRRGALVDGVYRVVVPRDDLEVSIDSMPVPTAAGIESSFRFYRCSCGKMNVIGEFVVADYEANDVMDTLRHHEFIVSSMAPLLIYDRPRLLAVRFQAEGEPAALAASLREALSWTGKERNAPATLPAAATK